MTAKEALKILKNKLNPCLIGEWKEATDMAISALQAQEAKTQLPGEGTTFDPISRQAAIDEITDENIIRNMDSVMDSEMHQVKRSVHRIIASIPSAQPEQRWIPVSERLPKKDGRYQVTRYENAKFMVMITVLMKTEK